MYIYRRSCRSLCLILSCLTVSSSCGIVYLRRNRTPESENKQTSIYLIKRKMKKKILYTYPHTGDQARSFEVDSAAPWQCAQPLDHVQVAAVRAAWHGRDRRCGYHAAETPLHDCTAVRVPKYHPVGNVKKVFITPPLHHVQVAALRAACRES